MVVRELPEYRFHVARVQDRVIVDEVDDVRASRTYPRVALCCQPWCRSLVGQPSRERASRVLVDHGPRVAVLARVDDPNQVGKAGLLRDRGKASLQLPRTVERADNQLIGEWHLNSVLRRRTHRITKPASGSPVRPSGGAARTQAPCA